MIYLDTCLLIYLVEEDPLRGPSVLARMREAGESSFAASPLVHLECLVKPMRHGNTALQRRYEHTFARLRMLEMPSPVYELATVLRARFGLRTPDALHLACAQHHDCEALWTHDDRLARASQGLAIDVLS